MSTWRTSKTGTGLSSNLNLSEPVGAANGDYQIVQLACPHGTPGTIGGTTGWTLLRSGTGTNGDFYVYVQVRSGAPTLTWTATGSWTGTEWHYHSFAPPSNKTWSTDTSAQTAVTTGTNPDAPSATASQTGDESVALGFNWAGGTWTAPSTYSLRSVNTGGLDCSCASKTLTASGAENPAAFSGGSGSNDLYAVTVLVKQTTTAPLTQSHVKFRNDDGSETTATNLASQDVNVTTGLNVNVRLRVQVSASGDPPSVVPSLWYTKNGGAQTQVPVGSLTTPTLSIGNSGNSNYTATTTLTLAYPTGHSSRSALVAFILQKPTTANGGGITVPAGWTLQAERSGATDGDTGGYTTTTGADVGNMNLYVLTKDTVTGSESGNLSVTVSADSNVSGGSIMAVNADQANTLSFAVGTGKDTSAGSVSFTTGSMDIAAGDAVLVAFAIPTDVSTPSQFSAEALSQTSTTFGALTELVPLTGGEYDTTTGLDLGGIAAGGLVTAGGNNAAVTFTATAGGTTTNVRGPGAVIRIRATGVANELFVAPSSNITAGGEATTAQLTSPGGSFTTGRMWDDENGTDAIDIGNNGYTELEWNMQAQSPTVVGDQFAFLTFADGAAIDNYTVTPSWTIGSKGIISAPRTFMPMMVQ